MKLDETSWVYHYRPPQEGLWEGREDKEPLLYFYERVQHVDLREGIPLPTTTKGFAILGFSSDEGVRRNQGRVGAYEGPHALKRALAPIPSTLPPQIQVIDAGDLICDHQDLEEAQESLGEAVARLREKGWFPIVLGGGHEVAFGHYLGLSNVNELSIVNIDAHFDLREGIPSSGTPFKQIANQASSFDYTCLGIQPFGNHRLLFEAADELGVNYLFADEWEQKIEDKLNHLIAKKKPIYLTLCLDSIAAPFAPGVSAPQPLGLMPGQVMKAMQKLASSGQVISFDIAELAPRFDLDQRTAKLAALFVITMIEYTKLT